MAKPEFFTVRESFIGSLKDVEVEYHKGEVVPADDPAVKKMPLHFEPLLVRGGEVRGEVEQATAAPGEKRRLRRKPAAKAKAAPAKAAPEPEVAPEQPAGKPISHASLRGE